MFILITNYGLCNKLRAIASALYYAEHFNRKLLVVWRKNNNCNIGFNDIYKKHPKIKILSDLPDEFKNLPISNSATGNQFDLTQKVAVLTTCSEIRYDSPPLTSIAMHDVLKTFVLKEPIKKTIDTFYNNNFRNNHVIGMHIRKTDNIAEAPLYLFIKQIKKNLKKYKDVKFFVATDSDDVLHKLIKKFPSRIIHLPKKYPNTNEKGEVSSIRSIKEGMIESVYDLYLLNRTNMIYGSYFSSFSELGSYIFKKIDHFVKLGGLDWEEKKHREKSFWEEKKRKEKM